jgi:MOSC domain-containing protein YiiM
MLPRLDGDPDLSLQDSGTSLANRTPVRVGRLVSINCSDGGVPKKPVAEAVITEVGVTGDRQNDLRYHGGPDRAVVIYSLDLIQALQKEGHPIGIGTAGENLTIAGVDWNYLVPGGEVKIGAVRLLVTQYAAPCYKISAFFVGGDVTRIAQQFYPAWSRLCTRVLARGTVRVGDPVQVTNG